MGDMSVTGLVTYMLMLGWSAYFYRYEHPHLGAAAVQAIITERMELRALHCPAYANLMLALSRVALGVVATTAEERSFRPLGPLMRAARLLFMEYQPFLTPLELSMVTKGF